MVLLCQNQPADHRIGEVNSIMKVVISEYSAGFSDYSWILCNELARYVEDLAYLTEQGNGYLPMIDKKVAVSPLFQPFKADQWHRKGSFLWYFDRCGTALKNCRRRNQYIKQNRPDVVFIQATLSAVDCYFLPQLKKYSKVVLIVHDVVVPVQSLSWSRPALKKTYETADLLVVHSKENKRQLHKIFGMDLRKIKVIPHGIRSSYRKLPKADCRKKLGISHTEKVFLFYGSIRSSKGLDILLRAMKGIDGTLIIAGAPFYGESFDKYQALIEKNKLKTIPFIEYTSDAFRDVLFQASDYLILPYKEFYSQSGVFMQAIQYHLPVIATDVSSFRAFIERYGIGYVCRPNDVASLHRTIQKACHSNKDFGMQMEQAVRENCWEVAAKMYAKLLRQLG